MVDLRDNLYHLARLALVGRRQDVEMLVRRMARKMRVDDQELSEKLNTLLLESPTRTSPLRSDQFAAVPFDEDSRLQLIRTESPVVLNAEPIWSQEVYSDLSQSIAERQKIDELLKAGLTPTRSLLLVGPPGVGKTLAARWIARELSLPLLVLDLSAVMSSYLGKTGTNLRLVLDYAKSVDCVLLLDELDAIAKRRDDETEIGELKRLVAVILQEIDDWPPTGFMVSATNHPDLLDPAVWRRFDSVIDFPLPNENETRELVESFLGQRDVDDTTITAAAIAFRGISHCDIERELKRAMRKSVVTGCRLDDQIICRIKEFSDSLKLEDRKKLGEKLTQSGFSVRKSSQLSSIDRRTLSASMAAGGEV